MKKIYFLISILLLSVLCLASCGKERAQERRAGDVITLNVYNWGEYVSDGNFDPASMTEEEMKEEGITPYILKYLQFDVNKEFENYFNTYLSEKYGGIKVKINYTTYPTNEDMYSKLESGSGSYDVIVPSDYMIEKLIAEGMIQPLNTDTLKGENYLVNLDSNFLNQPYDKSNSYSVPYTYGRVGIIYNTTMVDEEDLGSWDILWNPKYSGKILQFNNPRDAFGTAMYWKNLDVNSTNKADWDEALRLLCEQKQYLQGYVNDEIFDKMIGESAAIAPYFVGDYVTMYFENENLAFYYPEEGTNIFVDAMCIPTSSKNPDIAMEYINFMNSPDAAMANAIYLGYASPNTTVYNEQEYIDYMGEDLIALLYGDENGDGIYGDFGENGTYSYDAFYHNFTPEIQRHVNGLWEDLKVYGTAELWVHITSAVLVGAILSFAVYTTVLKKRRSRDYRLRDKAKKTAKIKN